MVRGFVIANAVALGVAKEISLVQQYMHTDVVDYEEDYDYDYDARAGKRGKSGKESPTPVPTQAPTTPAPTPPPTPAPTAAPTQARTWTGWANSWDQDVNWVAASGYVMTGIHSKYDNGKKDRLWEFESSKLLGSTSPTITGFVNIWDQEFMWSIYRDTTAVVGMYSTHDNGTEDRRFKIYGSFHGKTATGCYWTSETDYDAEWSISGNDGEAIVAMWSRHDNGKEDRIFKWRFCKLV
jgi:hypothetical protein